MDVHSVPQHGEDKLNFDINLEQDEAHESSLTMG